MCFGRTTTVLNDPGLHHYELRFHCFAGHKTRRATLGGKESSDL